MPQRRPRVPAPQLEKVVRRVGCRRLDQGYRDVARNGWDVALRGNLFLRLRGREHELYLLGGGWRLRVWPHYDDLTNPADRILNQLPRRDRHGAVGIDFHDNVVQSQASSLGLGESALLGIGPVFSCGSSGLDGLFPAASFLGRRSRSQLIDSLPQALGSRQGTTAVVGREHLRKNVGGGKRDFGERSMCGRALERQCIFEQVRQFAQLAQSAGRRVALQGVHGAANRTHDLLVAGILLQLQGFFVQRLQQFLRSLKKQLAQFRSTLIGRIRHSRTSIRW